MVFNPNLAEYYEELRAQALGVATTVATPSGMALLLRKGTAAWIQVWSSSLAIPERKNKKEPLPEILHSELAVLLAGMLLNRRCKDESPKSNSVSPEARRLPLHQAINA